MKNEKHLRLQEVTKGMAEPESGSECGFCSLLCQSTPHFMTEREIEVLAVMRRLKGEASKIKNDMRQMDKQGMSEDRMNLSLQLAELRDEWKRVDKERMDAAEERMRLLGHIQ
jgi:hypothetical protein